MTAPPLREVLSRIQHDAPHFSWSKYYLRLEDKVFLHGDVIDAGASRVDLMTYRDRFAVHGRSRGTVANLIYDAAVATRIHRVPSHVLHQPRRVTRRLAKYLTHERLTAAEGVTQVFFGHTHQPMYHVRYHQQTFHNAGSEMRHLEFSPCEFRLTPDGQDVIERYTT